VDTRPVTAIDSPADYYQSLVHSMDDGFFIIELITDDRGRATDFRFTDTNLAFEEQSGLADVRSKRVSEVVPDAGQYWVDEFAKVLHTGEPLRLTNEIGPQLRRFDVTATRIGGPESKCIGVLFRDVTHHAQNAEALRRSEERYRKLFESIDEGFCIVEVVNDDAGRPIDYRFIETNPSFEKQTGLVDAVGQTIKTLVPDHEQQWCEIYGEVAASGKPVRFQKEARALNRWFDVYAFPMGEPGHVAVLFNDISERMQTEQRLTDADRRKDEFLAMLAHELRNPLAPIGSAAELLDRGFADQVLVKQASAIIRRQVRHMTGLVDDLLDVSRVTRGLVTLEQAEVDVKRVLSEAVEQVRPLIEAKDHTLALHMPPEPAHVRGDQTRLVQVFTNLLNNAAKYTPVGGRIGVDLRLTGDEVEVVVSDNGIGLAPDFLTPAFDLFAQAARSADRAQGGLGIGLALVKSLVHVHRGTVVAASDGLGRGAAFTVHLPRLAQAPERKRAEPAAGEAGGQGAGLRVMVVDDNVDAAETLAMLVEAMGHEVIVEHGSRKALERARHKVPDVFLLDVGLPDVDGHELARRLRAQPETAGAMLAAITGYGQERDREAALAAGFDRHYVKPVGPDQLQELFEEVQRAVHGA
jgi:PAS domain S-box-containing protein